MDWGTIGLWAGMCLPLWDIPLIVRIIQRRSADDISLIWMWGIWGCSVLMAPSAFVSGDKAAIGFNVVNVIALTALLIVVLKYHKPASPADREKTS
jgi:uncharacterized protein with PQ loop repeat